METDFKILFLLVNYFNEEEVCTFINQQLQPGVNKYIDVIITDNGSRNISVLNDIKSKYINVSLVKADTNLGYFGAANLGLTNYLTKHKDYPGAIIICNTDMTLQTDFFNVLKKKLANGKFDILGPAIYSTFLKYNQNPYIPQRITTSKLKSLHFMSSNYVLYSLLTIYFLAKAKLTKREDNEFNVTNRPYAVHGSFMIFSKSFFEKGGSLNYPSVLFGEEIFVAEQARKLNLTTLYDAELKVEHHEHATTGVFKSPKAVKYLHQSYTYLLKAFFS